MKKVLLFFILFIIIPVILQVYLSRQKNRYLGLILPSLFFLFSILFLTQVPFFNELSMKDNLISAIMIFLYANIPTIILLVIYFICRQKFKYKNELDKMNIKDL